MTAHDDVQLGHPPPESCANCGFVSKFTADSNGDNGQDHVALNQYERWAGLDDLNEAVWQGRRIAVLQCCMRRGFLEGEAPVALSSAPGARAKTVEVLGKDRGEDSEQPCPQYTTWVPHLSLIQHWDERHIRLIEEDRRNWERGQENSRRRYEGSFTNRWLSLVVALGGIAASACIGLLSAFIGAEWITKPPWFGRVWPW